MSADGGCEWDVGHRMNEGCIAWGALKSVLSNAGFRGENNFMLLESFQELFTVKDSYGHKCLIKTIV